MSKTNGLSTQENVSMYSANRIWAFRDDKSFLNEPSPNCTPDGIPNLSLSGTWSLPDNNTLKLDYSTAYVQMQIVTLTKSKLVLRTTVVGGGGLGGGSGPDVEITYEFVPR